MIIWGKSTDDNSNTEYWAPSPYGETGDGAYYWRLSQRLENDKILWYENHDEDIMDEHPCDFESLEEAKRFVEEQHAAILAAIEPHV